MAQLTTRRRSGRDVQSRRRPRAENRQVLVSMSRSPVVLARSDRVTECSETPQRDARHQDRGPNPHTTGADTARPSTTIIRPMTIIVRRVPQTVIHHALVLDIDPRDAGKGRIGVNSKHAVPNAAVVSLVPGGHLDEPAPDRVSSPRDARRRAHLDGRSPTEINRGAALRTSARVRARWRTTDRQSGPFAQAAA